MALRKPSIFNGNLLALLAPGGRLGYALGWRWVFPIGTLPMPWHPWMRALPLLVLATGAALIAYAVVGRDVGILWPQPLLVALLLALPLSIPIVQWFAFFLRLPLLQAAMAPLAMLLLGVAVSRGQAPLAMAALPALFFGSHLTLAIAGRIALRRFTHTAAAIEADPPFPGAHRVLRLAGATNDWPAIRLLDRYGLDAIEFESPPDVEPRRLSRVSLASMPDAADLVKAIGGPIHAARRAERIGGAYRP